MVKSHSITFKSLTKKMKEKEEVENKQTCSRARLVLLSSVKQIGKKLEIFFCFFC